MRCHTCAAIAVLLAGTDHLGVGMGICPSCGKWYSGHGGDSDADNPSYEQSRHAARHAGDLLPDEDRFADLPEGL